MTSPVINAGEINSIVNKKKQQLDDDEKISADDFAVSHKSLSDVAIF